MVGAISKIFGVILVLMLTAILSTTVLSYMWDWYVMPVFHVPTPKLYAIYGIVLLATYFEMKPSDKKSSLKDIVSFSLARSLVVFSIGWVVQAIFA